MNVIEELKKLGRTLLGIDTSAIRGRVKFNRINRAVSEMQFFVATAEFSSTAVEGGKSEERQAEEYLQNLMEQMTSGSWRLQKVIDAVGSGI